MAKPINKILSTLLFASGVVLATPAAAIMIDINGITTDVGDVDIEIAITDNLNSSSASCAPNASSESNEECWVNGVLGDLNGGTSPDLNYGDRGETVSVYYAGAIGAFDLLGDPDYYVLKNARGWALFQNIGSTSHGVVDTSSSFFDGVKINVIKRPSTVSHVTNFNGGTTPVPEPATLALMGVGLAVFGFSRRGARKES